MDRQRIGRRIKAFRKLKGYTQIELAQKIDVPIAVLGTIERGTREASDVLINEIAHILQIDKEEILLNKASRRATDV